ncbi:hypothetical protein B0H11DRAFT_2089042 [Mycena galericulata]|nr:hypothetical protein B0H11DRAFT_2089042 [Mycena galericulata]
MAPPPLIGDGHGNYRVHIVGNSGVGKSTVGRQLADLLGVPFIPLDTLFWNSGWRESTSEEMREKVVQALANAPNGWVMDGNYTRRIGTIIEDRTTDVIWLDPPLLLYLPRLILRTFVRMFGLAPPCRPGCPEKVSRVFFSKESIIWWCISNHSEIGLGVGSNVDGQKMRRIGGWGEELRAWFRDLGNMLQRE